MWPSQLDFGFDPISPHFRVYRSSPNGFLSSLQRVAAMMNAGDIDASPVLDLGAIDRAQPAVDMSSRREREANSFSKTDQK